jgi:lipopolysaccharide biosynthesis protein
VRETKKLAIYAHYSSSNSVALYVLFYLRKLRELGFDVCFVSNSPIPASKKPELASICNKVIERENSGYDFCMWQRGLAEYDVAQLDELLLTNSSIVGPLEPLAPLWAAPDISGCDFWGLTDNDEFALHLQSYFIVFRKQVLENNCFREFWQSVLPFNDKEQMVASFEVGLTRWLEEHGFRWTALFTQEKIRNLFSSKRSLAKRIADAARNRGVPQNTSMLLPDLLLECGMPFLKASLLKPGADEAYQVSSAFAMQLLEASSLPKELVNELKNGA